MSAAIDKMMTSMFKNMLPPEIMEMLSPEKIKEMGETVNAFLMDQRAFMENTKNDLLDLHNQTRLILERLDNDGNSNQRPARKRIGKSADGSCDGNADNG